MADMDIFEFAAMIEETPVKTRVIEYRCSDDAMPALAQGDDHLAGVCLTDVLDDGLSLVYSFYDPLLRPPAWAPTSSWTISRSRGPRACPMSIWAIGCRAAARWTTSPLQRAGDLQGWRLAGYRQPRGSFERSASPVRRSDRRTGRPYRAAAIRPIASVKPRNKVSISGVPASLSPPNAIDPVRT